MHRTHVLLDCAVAIITIHTYKYRTLCLGNMVVIFPLRVFFQCPQQAPESQHSQGYKTLISYACISCAPEKAPEFGTFSTLATALDFHCCTMFQNCPGDVAAFIKLKYRIYCKVLMKGVSSLFQFCPWKAETNKSCLWALVHLCLDVSLLYDVSKLSERWPCSCIHHT